MIRQHHFWAVALFALPSLAASAQEAPLAPSLGFSIAERPAGNRADRPLFRRIQAAFAAANQGDGAFGRFLAPGADLKLVTFSGAALQRTPFTAATIRAATASCIGPYPFAEGADWVQLSWICRVDNVGPLAGIVTFQESPELSLTIWFEGGLIKRVEAMEPLSIPGRARVAMSAYAAMQPNR